MEQCYHIKPNCCVIRNVADVNKAIKCGCIQYHYPVATTIYPGTITLLEHPDICVRDYVFSEFLTKYSFLVAHNRFTDLCFSTEMQLDAIRHSKKRCVQKIQVKSWKYFHRMHCNTQEYQRSKLLTCEAAQKAIIKVDNELDLIHILEQVSEWREIAQLRNWEIGFRTSLESTVEPLKIPLDQIRQCYEKVLLKRDQLRKSFLG
ncbi:hypothetical protein K7432_014550 [Basidiobolus ranarum]|uniref:Uncharacterized protein n=1 Tax=Basidiobolus ranarum TaxID=34480 RepID=A0ABR2WHF0_9FUNG